jgi:predicted histidine transporter YuiF (NhaC family)
MRISNILLKSLHILSFKDNADNHTITVKFDFGVEKTYNLIPDTFDSLFENKERLKNFLSHTSKYELEKHVENVYQLI